MAEKTFLNRIDIFVYLFQKALNFCVIFRKINKMELSLKTIEEIDHFTDQLLILKLMFVKKSFFNNDRHIKNEDISLILALTLPVI